MSNETISEYFGKDHDRLDELFKDFQKNKHTDFLKAKEAFRKFKFSLQRHIIWEEDILFPLFEKKTGMTNGPTHVMRMEHRQIGGYLEGVHNKVKEGDPNTDPEEQSLLSVLLQHNLKEENILYPAIDNLMDESARKDVFKMMQEIPKERYEKCCQGH